MFKQFIVATVLVVSTFSANAEFITGKKLHEMVTSPSEDIQLAALAYMMGAYDAYTGERICTNKNVLGRELFDSTKEFLVGLAARSPKTLEETTGDAVVAFIFSEKYPCRNRQSI